MHWQNEPKDRLGPVVWLLVVIAIAGLLLFLSVNWTQAQDIELTWLPSVPLAFLNRDDFHWYLVSTEGRSEIAGPGELNLVWSPDGAYIAFESRRSGSNEIYVMDADGSNETRLTFSADNEYTNNPVWSPDGSMIAFEKDTEPTTVKPTNVDVYLMAPDGSNQRVLVNNSALNDGISWSPDGQFIAYSSNISGNFEIYIISIDGDRAITQQITDLQGSDRNPRWSPDGKMLAYVNYNNNLDDRQSTIQIVDLETRQAKTLGAEGYYNFNPLWSPDSQRIAFSVEHRYTMVADVASATIRWVFPNSSWLSWQNGSIIAITLSVENDPSIYIMDLNSGELHLVARNAIMPLWQPH